MLIFAGVLIFAAYFASCGLRLHLTLTNGDSVWHVNPKTIEVDFRNAMFASGAVLLVALTGGLWTTLLLRQTAAAFWITLLTPIGLLFLITLVVDKLFHSASDVVIFSVLYGAAGVYSISGFLLAHRLFHRAQDAAWTGGIVDFSKWRYFESGAQSTFSVRRHRPVAALLKKEFQLQSVSLICAGALLAVHLAIVVMRKMHGDFSPRSVAGTVSEFFWALWLVMPLIIGCTVVAEEQRLGLMEGQFCLPVSRRLQFALKFIPAILSGLFFGALVPLLVEGMAAMVGAPNPDFRFFNRTEGIGHIPPIIIVGFALGLSLAGIFASTFAKNFLQAMGITVATIIGCVLLTSFAGNLHSFLGIAWNPDLTIGMEILTALVIAPSLIYRNFKYLQERGRMWRRNVWGLTGAILFIVISSAALYNRAWEVFEPAEPAHGTAKLSLANPPTLQIAQYHDLVVRLPDGRVWFDELGASHYDYDFGSPVWWKYQWRMLAHPLPESIGPRQFLAGSNWVAATTACTYFGWTNYVFDFMEIVGIQPDGTLWISDKPAQNKWTSGTLQQFGSETNWRQLAQDNTSVVLLKTDGTLWRWGSLTSDFSSLHRWPGLRAFTPCQIGTNADWQELFTMGRNFARRTDGSVWLLDTDWKTKTDELLRAANYDQIIFKTASSAGDQATAFVRADGTLWMSRTYHQIGTGTNVQSDFVRVGTETNWTAVSLNFERMVALKSDGSLWQWHFSHRWNVDSHEQVTLAALESPTRLGIHSDWVAIANNWGNVVALAADGSLWLWPDCEQYEGLTLLKLPKQPGFLGNIFTAR